MLEILAHWFAAVCGQDPGHTWSPGGILLPCCQRCTGLYVGASVAALLHLWLRPRLSGQFLEIHGVFLLAMVPFGFHWVPQGPLLRTLSGVLFGFAVVTFLWLPLSQKARSRRRQSAHSSPLSKVSAERRQQEYSVGCLHRCWVPPALLWLADWPYFLVLGATLIVLPTTAMLGGAFAAHVLSGFAFCGVLALVALVIGDVSLSLLGALRLMRWLACARPQP